MPAYERSLGNANGVWELLAYMVYSPPADEIGSDRRALPPPAPAPRALGLPAPKGTTADPYSLLGKRVSKKFGRRYYKGTIIKYSKTLGYHIKYDDDDQEHLSATSQQRTPRQSSKPPNEAL